MQVDQFDVYREYILNYKIALSTIRKCKASNEQFNNIFSKVCEHVCIWSLLTSWYWLYLSSNINQHKKIYVSFLHFQELSVRSIQEVTTLEGGFRKAWGAVKGLLIIIWVKSSVL